MDITGLKPYRNYRGVKIYRIKEIITGSDFKILEDGTIKETRPKYNIFYASGVNCFYPNDSMNECKEDIDNTLNNVTHLTDTYKLKDYIKDLNDIEGA